MTYRSAWPLVAFVAALIVPLTTCPLSAVYASGQLTPSM
jgi:hypothetical protein